MIKGFQSFIGSCMVPSSLKSARMSTLASSRESQVAATENAGVISNKPTPTIASTSTSVINLYDDFEKTVHLAKRSLKAGNLIALPTDTIYGIAGLAQSSSAVRKIYEAKERDINKPVAICIGEADDVHKWAYANVPDGLLQALLPGPVTLVFRRRPELNSELNKGTSLIGIRVPRHRFMQELAEACGEPLALTSANKSGGQSTLFAEEFRELWPHLDLVVDGGCSSDYISGDASSHDTARLGSTVVDLSQPGTFSIIRDGSALGPTLAILKKFGLNKG